MKIELKKEIPLWLVTAIPFIYLSIIWNKLPDQVPLHWNAAGEIDRWGSKMELITLPFLLPVLIYVLLLVVPFIDPKKQLQKMGNKFYGIRFFSVLVMSILATVILFLSKEQRVNGEHLVLAVIGLLITVLGNFMGSIKPNYFVGVRTPWTLESDFVWKKTHLLTGKIWFGGGIVIILTNLEKNGMFNLISFFTVLGIISIIPVVYSYKLFQKEQKELAN